MTKLNFTMRQAARTVFGALIATTALTATSQAHADEIWALIAADTNDSSIGEMVEVDVQNMTRTLRDIAHRTGMRLHLQVVKGDDLTAVNLNHAVTAMNPTKDDVVMVYVTSHGLRDMNSSDPWPEMWISGGVPFSDMLGKLDDRDPRLIIALVDACNRDPADTRAEAVPAARRDIPGLGVTEYEDLFLDTAGYVVAAAASPGQYSMATSFGSTFTLDFIEGLEHAMSTPNADWDEVMAIAGKPTETDKKEHTYQSALIAMDIAPRGDAEPVYPF